MEKTAVRPVCILGAGPGDPELLTVRGFNRIKSADVILHDNLVAEAIINLRSPESELVNVGRNYGDLSSQEDRQQNINSLMRQYYQEGKNVLRLKSGDSFIFGRAIEEIRYLAQHAVPFEVIPGITAGIAAANLEFIPLTERTRSNSVVLCTGHTASYDFEQMEALGNMLKTGSSLIMYMALKSLREIVIRLKKVLPDELVHVSAISQVSMEGQKLVTGSLDEIEQKLEQADLPMPVVFIFGKHAYPVTQMEIPNA